MTRCQHCGHKRLVHDSWGCKTCGCLVSIVYLTSRSPSSEPQSKTAQEEEIREANELVAEADRLAELRIEVLRQRAIADVRITGIW